jgi:hypothetical protein
MPVKYVQLVKGTGGKKFKAVFFDAMKKKISSAQFGDVNYQSYPDHQDMARKQNYLSRHSKEDFENFMKPASLSRWILWNKTSLSSSYKDYRNRFNLELY